MNEKRQWPLVSHETDWVAVRLQPAVMYQNESQGRAEHHLSAWKNKMLKQLHSSKLLNAP